MQTITFHGHAGEHYTLNISRDGEAMTIQTSDGSATLPGEDEAANWIESRVAAHMNRPGRIIIRERGPGVTIAALQRYGVPISWVDQS